MRLGVGNEPVIGNLQEGGDRGRFVILARRPGRHLAERRNDGIVGCEEEVTPTCLGPVGEIIAGAHQFIADFLYAAHDPAAILVGKPVPEGGAEIEPIVKILGLDKDIGIEQVAGQISTPTSCPILLNVSVLRSEEHTSELQSLMRISYAVFCLKK